MPPPKSSPLPDSLVSNLLLNVTRVETWSSRDPSRHGYGTGFFFRYEWDNGRKATEFLVTNRHVVEGGDSGGFYLHRGSKLEPNRHPALWIAAQDWPRSWSFHPDPGVDVAIMNLAKLVPWFKEHATDTVYGALGPSQYATSEALSYLNTIEDVIIMGFPIGILDSENLYPIVRRGTTATPLTVDVNGETAFLVDAAIFPGSSGSPVLIAQEGAVARIRGRTEIGVNRLMLLGMVSKYFAYKPGQAASLVNVPVSLTEETASLTPLNLGYVVKTARIIEAVENFMRHRGEIG